MHALDSLTCELQTLNTEDKQAVDDITDKIVEPENVLPSLQITEDTTHTDLDKKQIENKQLLHTLEKKKIEASGFLPDIIRQFSNRNENPLQEAEIVFTESHITCMANLRSHVTGRDTVKLNENANQPKLWL